MPTDPTGLYAVVMTWWGNWGNVRNSVQNNLQIGVREARKVLSFYLQRPDVVAYLSRPKIKPILIFAGLGIFTSLVQTLVIDPNGGSSLPIFNVWDVFVRVVVAGMWFVGVVISLRRVNQAVTERIAWAVLGVGFTFLVTWADRPAAALMILPIVTRYWTTMYQAITLLLVLLVVSVLVYVLIPPIPLFSQIQEWPDLLMVIILTVSQGAFTYAAFELLLQNEQKQIALDAAYRELHQSQKAQLQHAAFEERAAISRELHDALGHELAALRLEVQRARQFATKVLSPSPPVIEALDGAMKRSGSALEQLQTAVSALRVPELDGTLFQALDNLIDAWPEPVRLTLMTTEPPLSTQTKLAFYRGVQEALTNSYKHAPNEIPQIQVNRVVDQLQIIVSNQKTGPPTMSTGSVVLQHQNSTGLTNLQQRFQELGGKVEIHDLEDEFTVWLTSPIAN